MKEGILRIIGILTASSLLILNGVNMEVKADSSQHTAHIVEAGESYEGNPLKGFVPFDGSVADFPHSMEWFYIPVNAVQTGMNEFDWSALETRLNAIAGRGHQAVFRFYYDYPGEKTGVPQFLINQGLEMKYYSEPSDLGGAGYCPNYEDTTFRTSMKNFISAFGERYDGDGRIGYITIGLLGFWGEWHNWPYDEDTSDGRPDWSISNAVYQEVLQAFDQAFNKTQVSVREPKNNINNTDYDIGYHDDSFANATLSVNKGGQTWSFMQKLIDLGQQDKWMTNCVGGEVYPPDQAGIFSSVPYQGSTNQKWEDCIAETHVSWLMCEKIKNYTGDTLVHAKIASKQLGYDFQVMKAYYDDTDISSSLYLKVDIRNQGIAPFYYDHTTWPVQIGMKQGDNLVKTWTTEWDLCDIAADNTTYSFEEVITDHGLSEGSYSICMKVINPISNGNILGFANAEQGYDGWLDLGSINIVETETEIPQFSTVFEAENSNNQLSGLASIVQSVNCSNGGKVGFIGNNSGSLLFENVYVDKSGTYMIDIMYLSGEQRNATINISNKYTMDLSFDSSGGWDVVKKKSILMELDAGYNTILFYNTQAWAPDIDCIVLNQNENTETEQEFFDFVVKLSDASLNWQIFLDTDNDSSTGYQDTNFRKAGFSYLIENNELYEYLGSGNEWNWVKVESAQIYINETGNQVEVRIATDSFENLASSVSYGIKILDNLWNTISIQADGDSISV